MLFWVPIMPPSDNSKRIGGCKINNPAYTKRKRAIAEYIRNNYKGEYYEDGLYEVRLTYFKKGNGDDSNFNKAAKDAITESQRVWKDDGQAKRTVSELKRPKKGQQEGFYFELLPYFESKLTPPQAELTASKTNSRQIVLPDIKDFKNAAEMLKAVGLRIH